jgi:hypothetical protein
MQVVEVRNEESGTDGGEPFAALKGKRMACRRYEIALKNQLCNISSD